MRRRWTWPSARSVRARSNGIGRRSCATRARSSESSAPSHVAARRLDEAAAAGTDREGPRRRRHAPGVLELVDDRLRPARCRRVASAASRRSPSSLKRPGWRVPLAVAARAAAVSWASASCDVAGRQRDEPEDAAGGRPRGRGRRSRAPARAPSVAQSPGLVGPAVVGRDERQAPQPPRREDVGPFPAVALVGGLGAPPRRRPVAAEDLQARQRHEVERVVAARTRLRPDQALGHLDRPVHVVELAGEPVGDAVGAVVLPRSAGLADQRRRRARSRR